jgi:hypothetical protein
MADRKLRKRETRLATRVCLTVLVDQVSRAASIAGSVVPLVERGDYDRALQAALDLEPILHQVDHALQSAAMLWRMTTER